MNREYDCLQNDNILTKMRREDANSTVFVQRWLIERCKEKQTIQLLISEDCLFRRKKNTRRAIVESDGLVC